MIPIIFRGPRGARVFSPYYFRMPFLHVKQGCSGRNFYWALLRKGLNRLFFVGWGLRGLYVGGRLLNSDPNSLPADVKHKNLE